jgi:YHS domain-containing protein
LNLPNSLPKVVAVLLLVAGAYLAGRWQTRRAEPLPSATARRVLYYTCPMHPQYKSDRPGTAPCCGMRLEPVYADGGPAAGRRLAPGTVQISPEKQQLIGVQYGKAEITSNTPVIRAAGKVAYDQKQIVVLADVFEYETPLIHIGQSALITRPYPPRKSFWAKVDYIYPRLDAATRTLKVRLNAGTPGFQLVPDTLLDVEFRVAASTALTVPAQAVLDSGLRKTAFVDLGDGYLEPRPVETGRRFGDRIEILKGLRAGERVAISGNFLIDSESQLKAAAAGMRSGPGSPERAAVPQAPAGMREEAKPSASAEPAATLAQPAAGAVHKDPVCGMEVVATNVRGRTSEYRGRRFYFCSDECKRQFDMNPEYYGDQALKGEQAPAGPPTEKPPAPGAGHASPGAPKPGGGGHD